VTGISGLSLRYLSRHRLAARLLCLSCALALSIPCTIDAISKTASALLRQRASSTPLIIGAKGSTHQLVFSALYFKGVPPQALNKSKIRNIVSLIPLHLGHRIGDVPLVGTSFAYFNFRELRPQSGSLPIRLGDIVAGATAAKRLELKQGSHLVAQPSGAWSGGAALPVKLRVTGILAPTQSPDDTALFASLDTSWLLSGKYHGHEELRGKQPLNTTTFVEITQENLLSFHLHGNRDEQPIHAFILDCDCPKDTTIAKGVANTTDGLSALYPLPVIDSVLSWLVALERLTKAYGTLVIISTLALVILIALLVRVQRAREFHMLYRLGCARRDLESLWVIGLGWILLASLILAYGISHGAATLFEWWWLSL